MRKAFVFLFCVFGSFAGAQASETIEIDAGNLYNSTGTAFVPVGGLLQLIASPVSVTSPDGVFTPPTSTAFVTGSDILVESFSMNYGFATGEADEVANFFVGGTSQAALGDALLLRWYPTLTTTSTSPGLGATYGQYRSDTAESDEPGISWFVPSVDGQTLSYPTGLDFNTMAEGGSNLEIAGYASNIVLVGVPEPSTYAPLCCAAACLIGLRLRGRTGISGV